METASKTIGDMPPNSEPVTRKSRVGRIAGFTAVSLLSLISHDAPQRETSIEQASIHARMDEEKDAETEIDPATLEAIVKLAAGLNNLRCLYSVSSTLPTTQLPQWMELQTMYERLHPEMRNHMEIIANDAALHPRKIDQLLQKLRTELKRNVLTCPLAIQISEEPQDAKSILDLHTLASRFMQANCNASLDYGTRTHLAHTKEEARLRTIWFKTEAKK